MNIGDTITIPPGKEKEPAHAGIPFTIDSINGDNLVLKMKDGTLYNGYTKSDLTIPVHDPPKFKEPEVLEVLVNPNEKVKDAPTQFSFAKPQEVQKEMAKPTKVDVQAPEQPKHPTLEEVKAQIAREETPKANSEYSDFYDDAEMAIDALTLTLASVCNWYAQDTSLQSYEYPKPTADKLKRQLTKIMIKRNIRLPIEYSFVGTIIGGTAPILLKTKSRRKLYDEMEAKKTPEEKVAEKAEKVRRKPGGQKKS